MDRLNEHKIRVASFVPLRCFSRNPPSPSSAMQRIEAEEEEEEEVTAETIIDAILPPRPEDAGLEDCALPPESIIEAFSRAAAAVEQIPDKLLAAGEILPPVPPSCGVGGEEAERKGDKDGGEGRGFGFGGKRGCLVGGEVLPGVNNGRAFDGDFDEDGEDEDGAILVEGLI